MLSTSQRSITSTVAAPCNSGCWTLELPRVSRLQAWTYRPRVVQAPQLSAAWLDAAEPWQAVAAQDNEAARIAGWEKCRHVAEAPDILELFLEALHRRGVVGEKNAACIIFLAIVSRLLDRPVSIVVKGPSSAGKSYIALQVLALFPENASYALSAMSERCLAYSEVDLRHRFWVLYEAAALQGGLAHGHNRRADCRQPGSDLSSADRIDRTVFGPAHRSLGRAGFRRRTGRAGPHCLP